MNRNKPKLWRSKATLQSIRSFWAPSTVTYFLIHRGYPPSAPPVSLHCEPNGAPLRASSYSFRINLWHHQCPKLPNRKLDPASPFFPFRLTGTSLHWMLLTQTNSQQFQMESASAQPTVKPLSLLGYQELLCNWRS